MEESLGYRVSKKIIGSFHRKDCNRSSGANILKELLGIVRRSKCKNTKEIEGKRFKRNQLSKGRLHIEKSLMETIE